MSNSQLPGSATDLFNALDKKPQGGIQPPGSTNSVRRLLDAEFGGSAASIFAGEETLRSAVGTVGLWDEKSKETSRVRHDADLLAR